MIWTFFLAFSLFSSPKAQEKIRVELHNSAEAFFSKGDYKAAKDAYLELLEKIQDDRLDWTMYTDIVLRAAETRLILKEYKEGEELLLSLLDKSPPRELLSKIAILLARIYSLQEEAGKGYLVMKRVSTLMPIESWRPEEKTFFHAVIYALNAFYENHLQKGKHFFAVGDYANAIATYEILLSGIENGYFPSAEENFFIKKKVLFRLAESHFQSANYERTLALAESASDTHSEIDTEMIFLAASAYKEKREYEKALQLFQEYLSSADKDYLFHYEVALCEIGYYYLRMNNREKAKEYFQTLLETAKLQHSRTLVVASICLGKIYLEEKNLKLALQLFSCAETSLAETDPLISEISYLQGEVHFFLRNFKEASQLFEKALIHGGEWSKASLFKLALCFKALSEGSTENRIGYLKKAESILEKLFLFDVSEPITLTLAEVYLLQDRREEMNTLLAEQAHLFSEEGSVEVQILRARMTGSYAQREALYNEILLSPDKLKSHAKCWYYRGLNHLEWGMASCEEKESSLKKALQCFNEAFSHLATFDTRAANDVLQIGIKVANLINDIPQSLSLLEKMSNELEYNDRAKEERLFLKGMLYSKMEGKPSSLEAMTAFKEIIAEFPASEFYPQALASLATLYFKRGVWEEAEKSFIELVERFPTSSIAEDGYYWAAEAAEKGNKEQEKVRFLRTLCYEKTPFSSKAAESYFKCYSFDDYLNGHPKALEHIRPFVTLYPQSPYVSIAYYFLGLYEPSIPISQLLLEKAHASFKEKAINAECSDPLFFYFQCKTELELAKISTSSDLDFALNTLLALLDEIQKKNTILEIRYFSSLYEESQFALLQLYMKQGQEIKAEEILLSLLKYYNDSGIKEGYYLAKTWQEQGDIALKKNDIKTALACFEIAIDSGKKHLSDEERLTIKINMSHCFRWNNDFDMAMRTLSQVINEECNSSLRFKAMLLRAEIYELQGRKELAIKQLEALSKFEGNWAEAAEAKLRSSHGAW